MTCLRQKTVQNTPGTEGGPGGRDRTLAVKKRKIGRFPEVGQKQKTEREKKESGLNDGRKHASRLGKLIRDFGPARLCAPPNYCTDICEL